MKKGLAVLVSLLLLLTSLPMVVAQGDYNDDELNWGETLPANPDNLIANGYFDKDAAGWETSAGTTVEALRGSLRGTYGEEGGSIAYPIALKPHTAYLLTFDAHTAQTGAVDVRLDSVQSGETVQTMNVELQADWEKYSWEFFTGADEACVLLFRSAVGGQKIWLDNVVLLEQEHTAHDYVGEITTEPTCSAAGVRTYTCSICGDSYTEVVAALGHTPVVVPGYDATCTENGLTDGEKCGVCGVVLTEQAPIVSQGHQYDSVITVPDCENSGYTIHTCTVCGHRYVDGRVEALGHDYQVVENEEPTCVAAGMKVYACVNCGDSYTETVPATGRHIYDYQCDEDCNVCGYKRDDAHNYIYHSAIDPTCGEDGQEAYKCWNCGSVIYYPIPATGNHRYSGACDAECNVCGFVRDSVETHDYELTASVELTCVTDGVKTYTCKNCGDTYTETVFAVGHKYDIVITDPDCENGGYTTHTCTACGEICVDNRTDPLGHTPVAVPGYDATCTESGLTAGEKCGVCGEVLTAQEVIAAKGHDYALTKDVVPTCTAEGRKVYTCYDCGDSYTEVVPDLGGHIYDNDRDADCNVCGEVRTLPGDVNNDGDVNNRDLALMQQFLNGWDVKVDLLAADVYSDGQLNNRDLAQLQRNLNQ